MEPIRRTLAPRGRSCVEPLMQARKWAMCWKEVSFLRWVRKPTAYKRGETFYFPAGQEHWLEAGKWGATDPVDLLPAKFLMIKEITVQYLHSY